MRNCPKSEVLLEYISVPGEISLLKRTSVKFHVSRCASCRSSVSQIQNKLADYFSPEPDVTSSLLNVYSRLQKDETLILKGWKLGEISSSRRQNPVASGWVFRGAVVAGLAIVTALFLVADRTSEIPGTKVADNSRIPFAQIRLEDSNNLEVRYIEPELLHSVEFETTNVSHTITR